MRMDLPSCGFKNCRFSFDCNCINKVEYERCEYRFLKEKEIEEMIANENSQESAETRKDVE